MGLLTMDDGIVNWGEHTEDKEINHALMAISSRSIGTSSEHSVDPESEISRVPQEVYVSTPITTNEKGVSAPKSKESFDQRLMTYYEKKMAKEAEFKKQRVFNTGNGVAKPVWTNTDRINHANQFVPRPVQLNTDLDSQYLPALVLKDHSFCETHEKGIKQEYSNARIPQQNGVAKRMNRTLIEAARTMLANSLLPTTFWAEAVSTACYIFNRSTSSQTPNSDASKEKDKDAELIVMPSTVMNTEENVESRKSSTNSKKEEILTEPQQEKEAFSTDISEDNPKILAFRRELEEIALKHLRTVSENNSTNTPLVNFGSELVNTGQLDPDNSPMPELEIFHKSETGIFDEASYDEEGVIIDFNSLPIEIEVSSTPTLRIHNIHPKSQILGDPKSVVQTRSKVQQKSGAHALFSYIQKQQRNNHKDQQHCLFACFLSQEEPKKISEALQDDSWVQAMQEELLQFKLQQVWVLVDLPHGMKVYVLQPPGFVDPDRPKKVYKVVKALYGLHQAPRSKIVSMGELPFFLGLQVKPEQRRIFISQDKYVAEILKKFDLVSVKTAITPMETKVALTKDEEAVDVDVHLYRSMIFTLTLHLNAVKRIFKYLKGKPNLGLWYPRESPFDLEAFSDSNYSGSNLDRISTTGGCQFLGQRLISWQCKKQTIVATSTTEAEYVSLLVQIDVDM
ncbi:putative ribonuclease H-like domain-containing protein [Tanacetum coccineum]